MSNVIDFLEKMGQDASLHSCTQEQLERHLQNAGIDPLLAAALRSGDYRTLERMIGANEHVCCLIRTPGDEEEDDDQSDEDKVSAAAAVA